MKIINIIKAVIKIRFSLGLSTIEVLCWAAATAWCTSLCFTLSISPSACLGFGVTSRGVWSCCHFLLNWSRNEVFYHFALEANRKLVMWRMWLGLGAILCSAPLCNLQVWDRWCRTQSKIWTLQKEVAVVLLNFVLNCSARSFESRC